jgi:hypothetical protein
MSNKQLEKATAKAGASTSTKSIGRYGMSDKQLRDITQRITSQTSGGRYGLSDTQLRDVVKNTEKEIIGETGRYGLSDTQLRDTVEKTEKEVMPELGRYGLSNAQLQDVVEKVEGGYIPHPTPPELDDTTQPTIEHHAPQTPPPAGQVYKREIVVTKKALGRIPVEQRMAGSWTQTGSTETLIQKIAKAVKKKPS